MLSGVLDSIFSESDDATMRSNRQLSGLDERNLETLAEADKSSMAEKFKGPKIESLADIESIRDGRVILKPGVLESENENGNIGEFSEDNERIKEGAEEEKPKENTIEKRGDFLPVTHKHFKVEHYSSNPPYNALPILAGWWI